MIYKIDGCDLMWCIKCHASFSWKTGVISTGVNHNPEYFRWLRENGQTIARNPEDVLQGNGVQGECGQLITANSINIRISDMSANGFMYKHGDLRFMLDIYRFKVHNEETNLHENDYEKAFRKSRVEYLLDDITKDELKKNIQQIDKRRSKSQAIRNVWVLVDTVMTEILDKFFAMPKFTPPTPEEALVIKEEIENFRKYANKSLVKISEVYSYSSVPGITKLWEQCVNIRGFQKHHPELI